jgi:hypothetical protein
MIGTFYNKKKRIYVDSFQINDEIGVDVNRYLQSDTEEWSLNSSQPSCYSVREEQSANTTETQISIN